MTLDQVGCGGALASYLVATLDMSSYGVSTDEVLLSFSVRSHDDDDTQDDDRVWVRGSSADTWLEVFDLAVNTPVAGQLYVFDDVDVTGALVAGAQDFSDTFQLRFGQDDDCAADSLTTGDGFTFDDVGLSLVACGDGVIEGTEECDDGDTDAGDGCDATCAEEAGWTCNGEPSTCDTVCGDGVVAGDEGCDDGNTAGGDGCDEMCAVEMGMGGAGGDPGPGAGGADGGAGGGDGGAGGDPSTGGTGAGDVVDSFEDDSGCSCRSVNGGDHEPLGYTALLLVGASLARRRRTR